MTQRHFGVVNIKRLSLLDKLVGTLKRAASQRQALELGGETCGKRPSSKNIFLPPH